MANKMLMGIIKILLLIFLSLLLVYFFIQMKNFGYGVFSDQAASADAASAREAKIEVKEDESLSEISKDLEEKGIIADDLTFTLSLRFMEGVEDIKAGTYTVNSSMKPSQILEILTNQEE